MYWCDSLIWTLKFLNCDYFSFVFFIEHSSKRTEKFPHLYVGKVTKSDYEDIIQDVKKEAEINQNLSRQDHLKVENYFIKYGTQNAKTFLTENFF